MFTLGEVAKVVGATNEWQKWADIEITNVEFDTRKVTDNGLFVPLIGNRDGHEFIKQAMDNGSVVSFWESSQTRVAPKEYPLLVVRDNLIAMQQLAHYFLKKIGPRVVGITGSNGKTTTKDMLDSVLSQKYKTYKTQGNYNNHIGLPYTILHMPIETEVIVLEMGMNHRDEIRHLSLLAEPEVAAITIIGESHMEFLGSRQGIAEAKMEIAEGLQENGLLIIPSNEELLIPLIASLSQNILTFGQDADAKLQARIINRSKNSVSFTVNKYPETTFMIPVVGDYNVNNALIAIAVGAYFELSPEAIKKGLAELHLTHSRAEWKKAWNGAEILNDAYNANPTAMTLVLETFSQIPLLPGGKRIAVLADMGELGDQSVEMHREMYDKINQEAISLVILYGTLMRELAKEFNRHGKQVIYFEENQRQEMASYIKEHLNEKDLILFKGSNSMKLAEIVTEISESESKHL